MMNFTILDLEPMTLAFANDRDESLATQRLETFLAASGILPAHRYQNEMVMKKNGVRLALYIKYAVVPAGTPKTKDVNINDMPGGQALAFRVSQTEYVALQDGDLKAPLDEYMKAHDLSWDLRRMIALAEPKTENGVVVYDVLFPVKRK